MPKLKTNRSVKKRIRITASGSAKHFKAGKSHLLVGKRSKRKRLLGKPGFVAIGELKNIHKILPYGA